MKPDSPATIHDAVAAFLKKRGFASEKDMLSFLMPTLSELPSPDLMAPLGRAASLIVAAMREGNDILIWGDYDADGITSTALLIRFFRELGVDVLYHIPNRMTDGYGLNIKGLDACAATMSENKILITVDCGISDHEQVLYARSIGFQVIVTDHHLVPETIPDADVVINPRQHGCQFPYKEMAGVGIAFYLAIAVRKAVKSNISNGDKIFCNVNLKSFLDLVCIGTIADVVPLTDVNRVLTKGGMEVLANQRDRGLAVLFDHLGLTADGISGETVSFQVAPVLNAAGRMGNAQLSLDLLISKDPAQMKHTARRLIAINEDRKKRAREDFEAAADSVDRLDLERSRCIIIRGQFHQGILGITAARLTEQYGVPSLVMCPDAREASLLKCSGRAPEGIDLHALLFRCSHILQAYGGHAAAAGLSIRADRFAEFKKSFSLALREHLANNPREGTGVTESPILLSIDEALDPVLLKNLRGLEPFGEGNERPLFMDPSVRFITVSPFGRRNEHFKALARSRHCKTVPVIGYCMQEKLKGYDPATGCSLVYSHFMDTYNGKVSWKLRAENVWPNSQA